MKQWILVKYLCDRVYFWAIFYATGYRVLSGLPHTPVTSLVKYSPPGGKERVKIFLNFTYLHKAQPGRKAAGNFPNFVKISARQMFGHPGLDAG